MRHQTPLRRPGAWTTWQLRRLGADPLALAHLALRTKSDTALDAVALIATRGRRTADQVVADPTCPLDNADHAAALALALAGMARSEAELTTAARVYQQLWAQGALATLAPIHHQGLGQSLFLAGRHDELRRVLPDLTRLHRQVRHDLEVDLANPHLDGVDRGPEASERWQRLLATRFVEAGLEPVSAPAPARGDSAGSHPFDRLTAGATVAGTADGPLVTVIMPCFRPDEGLLTSIASLRDQSWGNLEILVVDDDSGADFDDVFARALALDDRAQLLRQERNGGSYLARNAALPCARGEFVTFQDADDWSHPRRIEHQVALLLGDADAPASRSLAVRARDDLTHQWFGYRAVRDNASSLLVRRQVFEQIGPFAPIRKGADSEYAERLTILAGPIRDTRTPLAITRLRAGSLSRGDFTYQWASPERLQFKGSYRAWHRQLRDTPRGPRTATPPTAVTGAGPGLHPAGTPPFPVPRTFLRGLDSFPRVGRLPLAYLGDFSSPPGQGPGPLSVERGATDPAPVGVWHAQTLAGPLPGGREEMHRDWFDAVLGSAGQLVPLTRLEDIRVDRLVVLDPRVLLLAGAQACRVQVDRVEVELTPHLCRPDASGLPVDLLGVADVCRSWWGQLPHWVAAPDLDDAATAELAALLPGLLREHTGG